MTANIPGKNTQRINVTDRQRYQWRTCSARAPSNALCHIRCERTATGINRNDKRERQQRRRRYASRIPRRRAQRYGSIVPSAPACRATDMKQHRRYALGRQQMAVKAAVREQAGRLCGKLRQAVCVAACCIRTLLKRREEAGRHAVAKVEGRNTAARVNARRLPATVTPPRPLNVNHRFDVRQRITVRRSSPSRRRPPFEA